jgi:alpha-L-fucosidase
MGSGSFSVRISKIPYKGAKKWLFLINRYKIYFIMKTRLLSLLFILILFVSCKQKTVDYLTENKADHDQRMEWWQEARFGMFIHWGLYAVPAGEWNGQTNHAEWIRETAQIPLEEYNQFLDKFNPVKFNADDWVAMAKDAGMKYIVITSKHHDGFGLFDSRQTEFDVMSTPFKRDILKELSKACEKQDMTFCFYHSIMDWHHPDYCREGVGKKPGALKELISTGIVLI